MQNREPPDWRGVAEFDAVLFGHTYNLPIGGVWLMLRDGLVALDHVEKHHRGGRH